MQPQQSNAQQNSVFMYVTYHAINRFAILHYGKSYDSHKAATPCNVLTDF